MARYRADRADAQTMITAQQHRHAVLTQLGVYGVVDGLVPLRDLRQVPISGPRRLPGVARPAQIAEVVNLQPARLQRSLQTRHP